MYKTIGYFYTLILFFFLVSFTLPSATFADETFDIFYSDNNSSTDVVVNGDYAYVSGQNKVRTYNVSDLSNVHLVDEFIVTSCLFSSITTNEDKLFSAMGGLYYLCGSEIYAFDISNPADPEHVNENDIGLSQRGAAQKIQISNNKMFVAKAQEGFNVIDITNLDVPITYPIYNPGSRYNLHDLVVRGDTAFGAHFSGGFVAVDFSNPAFPQMLADIDTNDFYNVSYSTGIDLSGNYLYLTGGSYLRIYDISDLNNVRLLSKHFANATAGLLNDVSVMNDLAFVVASSIAPNLGKLTAVNIADPANPETVGSIIDPLMNDIRHVDVYGDVVYLTGNSGFRMARFSGLEDNSVEPFLELPWDYESNGMTFSEAALSINAYFDHEYPLLSTGLNEGENANGVLSYDGENVPQRFYTKHDGYDWGSTAKTKNGVSVLASADGIASFHNECGACGNAIHIDHGNGFQTRYYHLSPEDLTLTETNEEIDVVQGQKIGEVGFTGNISPSGEAGSHLHFMVIQDKNNDGNFADNIPDGLVDPFGWSGTDPDPWSIYDFVYHGLPRTGNVSNYLWKHSLASVIEESGGNATLGRYGVTFPYYSSSEAVNLNLEYSSIIDITDEIRSVSPSLRMNATDNAGDNVDYFSTPFLMRFDLSDLDLTTFVPDSLSIYSSHDGNDWMQENSVLDMENMEISAEISHLSFFTVAGELRDSDPPISTLISHGDEGEIGYFRSDVEIAISADDDESGISNIIYSLDDGEARKYTGVFTVSEEGHHVIEYYSEDIDGNVEEINIYEFNIDKTYPSIRFKYDKVLNMIVAVGEDDREGVVLEEISNNLNTTVLVADKSGNKLIVKGDYKRADVRNNLTLKSYVFGEGGVNVININFDGRIASGFMYQTLLDSKKNILYISKYDSGLSLYKVQKKSLSGDGVSYHSNEIFLYVEIMSDNLILGYE